MIGKEAQLESECLRALDLCFGDQRVVFQPVAMVGPRVRLENGLGRVENQLDRPLALGVNRDVIARAMKSTELVGKRLEVVVERSHVASGQMHALPGDPRVLVGFRERSASGVRRAIHPELHAPKHETVVVIRLGTGTEIELGRQTVNDSTNRHARVLCQALEQANRVFRPSNGTEHADRGEAASCVLRKLPTKDQAG